MPEERTTSQLSWQVWNGIRDFSEGYIDKIEDHLVPDNASPDCQNVIATEIGSLRIRGGQARFGPKITDDAPVQGMHAHYTSNKRWLVVAAGGSAYYWDAEDGIFRSIADELDKDAQVCFATCANYMVAFNGKDAPWKWDGDEATALTDAPTDGQFAILYREKLFTVPKTTPSTLVWSDSFQPEQWPAVNYWDVRPGDGDVITCIVPHLGELLVFKRRSLHTFAGTTLDDFRLDTRNTSIGCVGPFAAVAKEPSVYFISDEGLCTWNGMTVTNLSSYRIPNLWERVNKKYLHRGAVGVWGDHIWFAVPEGDSTYNNLVIICEHTSEDARFWPLRGINAACFLHYDDGERVSYYTGDALQGCVNQQLVGNDDFGQPINAYWQSKTFDVGFPEHLKKFKEVILIDSPSNLDLELQASLDYGRYNYLLRAAEDDLVRRYRFPAGSYGRYLSLKLVHNTTDSADVRGITALYRPRRRMR